MLDLFPLARPLLHRLDPEKGHDLVLSGLEKLPLRRKAAGLPASLRQRIWDLNFDSPLGLAAGFDKEGRAVGQMLGFGFGFVEVGSITPRPQPGNPRPRLFRLAEDRAVINRMGFNSGGIEAALPRLQAWRQRLPKALVGINLGKNKESADALPDYRRGVEAFAALASYLVINVSSPNTPGLRDLQARAELDKLIGGLVALRDESVARVGRRVPLLVKIAPDLGPSEIEDVVAVALARGLDGLVVTNTTLARPESLRGAARGEAGGLSGAPLFEPSTEVLRQVARLLRAEGAQDRLVLIGVGGVASGAEAFEKIRAGARLVQLYSALVYQGPALARWIAEDLARRLEAEGFANVQAAVGSGLD